MIYFSTVKNMFYTKGFLEVLGSNFMDNNSIKLSFSDCYDIEIEGYTTARLPLSFWKLFFRIIDFLFWCNYKLIRKFEPVPGSQFRMFNLQMFLMFITNNNKTKQMKNFINWIIWRSAESTEKINPLKVNKEKRLSWHINV